MVKVMADVLRRSKRSREICRVYTDDRKKAPILTRVAVSIENGDLTEADLREFLQSIPPAPDSSAQLLMLDARWRIVREENGFATVTDGVRAGITPTVAAHHYSWDCPYCGRPGPWDGVICRSCGNRSDGG
jgi:hypothetical protein